MNVRLFVSFEHSISRTLQRISGHHGCQSRSMKREGDGVRVFGAENTGPHGREFLALIDLVFRESLSIRGDHLPVGIL